MKMKQTIALMLLMGALLVPEIAKAPPLAVRMGWRNPTMRERASDAYAGARETGRRGAVSVGLKKPTMGDRARGLISGGSDRLHELSGGEVGTFSATHRGRRKGREIVRKINKGLDDAGKAGIETGEAVAASLGLFATKISEGAATVKRWFKAGLRMNKIQDQLKLEFARAGNDPDKLTLLKQEIKAVLAEGRKLAVKRLRAEGHTSDRYRQGDLYGLLKGTNKFGIDKNTKKELEDLLKKVGEKFDSEEVTEAQASASVSAERVTARNRDAATKERGGEGVAKTPAQRRAERQARAERNREIARKGGYKLGPKQQQFQDENSGTDGDGESAGEQAHKRSWIDRLLGRNKPSQNQVDEGGGEEGYGE